MKRYMSHFMHHESFGGLCLILATAMALLCANSSFYPLYQEGLAMQVKIGFSITDRFFGLDKPVSLWINDGLMSLFFLLVGLEIKREMVIGELSTRTQALQPLLAAIGGMVIPILIFVAVNYNSPDTMRGWAVPCATDIAFALGVLTLVGSRVPTSIKILLTAIAIVDDLLAILVIAFFYTDSLEWTYLLSAVVGLVGLVVLNYVRSSRISFYLFMGAAIWWGFLKAGIHPTLAAVVTAIAIPLEVEINGVSKSPLIRLEHALHGWVIFLVIPIFAFANAGLSFAGTVWSDLLKPLSLGVMLGLVLGKPLGIMGGLWIGHVSGLAVKQPETKWVHYLGVSVLCGIGFTMSLFIGELAFNTESHIAQVKLGILAASLLTAIAGWLLCRMSFRESQLPQPL